MVNWNVCSEPNSERLSLLNLLCTSLSRAIDRACVFEDFDEGKKKRIRSTKQNRKNCLKPVSRLQVCRTLFNKFVNVFFGNLSFRKL